MPFNRRSLRTALVSSLVATAAFSAAPGTASAAGCAGADAKPGEVSGATAQTATLCLLNEERRERGLRGLRHNDALALAADRHATDMVRRNYFSHDTPAGTDFVDRIMKTSYVSSSRPVWTLGENLAWGTGTLSTPRSIVRSWMKSPGHRANILQRRYREIGIGIALGAPMRGPDNGATYATSFGARR